MSQSLTYAILGGTGLYCLSAIGYRQISMPSVAYSIIAAQGIFGLLKEQMENEDINKVHTITTYLEILFPFPCIVGQLWTAAGIHKDSWILPGLSMIPLVMYFCDDDIHRREQLVDTILTINFVCGIYVSLIKENWMALGTTLLFAMTHGIVKSDIEHKEDSHNIFIALFAICSLLALGKT